MRSRSVAEDEPRARDADLAHSVRGQNDAPNVQRIAVRGSAERHDCVRSCSGVVAARTPQAHVSGTRDRAHRRACRADARGWARSRAGARIPRGTAPPRSSHHRGTRTQGAGRRCHGVRRRPPGARAARTTAMRCMPTPPVRNTAPASWDGAFPACRRRAIGSSRQMLRHVAPRSCRRRAPARRGTADRARAAGRRTTTPVPRWRSARRPRAQTCRRT